MAIRSIAQLKTWFKRGAYPTSEQFADWLDSFFHKNDKISIDNVDGLVDKVNSKYEASSGYALEVRQTEIEGNLQTLASQNSLELNGLYESVSELKSADETITARIAELQGRGGSIPAGAFSVQSPTETVAQYMARLQPILTEYASRTIWGDGGSFNWNQADPASSDYDLDGDLHYAYEIFNSTWTRNTDNGHRIVLANTQDTNPKVFEWADVGVDTVNIATAQTAGLVKSDPITDSNPTFVVDVNGGVDIIWRSAGATGETLTKFTNNISDHLRGWLSLIIGKINGIITALGAKQDTLISGSNIKTVNGQSLLGTGDIQIQTIIGDYIDVSVFKGNWSFDGLFLKITGYSNSGYLTLESHIPANILAGILRAPYVQDTQVYLGIDMNVGIQYSATLKGESDTIEFVEGVNSYVDITIPIRM